jgi:hypothetical protein
MALIKERIAARENWRNSAFKGLWTWPDYRIMRDLSSSLPQMINLLMRNPSTCGPPMSPTIWSTESDTDDEGREADEDSDHEGRHNSGEDDDGEKDSGDSYLSILPVGVDEDVDSPNPRQLFQWIVTWPSVLPLVALV